jgi:acetyl-CoA carboxylase biotin carboxyl carrier protein
MVNESNIGEVSIEQKDFKITIRQKEEQITQVMASMPGPSYAQFSQQAPPAALPASSAPAAEAPKAAAAG